MIPIGTLTRKHSRQPYVGPPRARITPPSTGPVAVATPTAVPIRPNARPRSQRGNICCTSPDTCGLSRPPAKPCSTRPATSTDGLGASPTIALNTTKDAIPICSMSRRPRSSPSRPPMIGTIPNASAYPETTHCSWAGPAPVARPIGTSATLTMLTSSRVM